MPRIKNIFWNIEESRIRSGYRLILLIATYIVLSTGFEKLIGSIISPIKLSSSAPLWFFLIFSLVILIPGLLSVWLAGRFLDRRFFKEFGFQFDREWWIDMFFGLGLGIILISIVFVIEITFGWVTIEKMFFVLTPDIIFVLPISFFLIIFLCVGISEELVSRGYLLKNLAEGCNIKFLGPRKAIICGWVLSSVVFGLFHLDNNNATFLSTLNITIGGIFLGTGYVLTGKLAIPIGFHITWNFFMANVFGFPVSGNTIPSEVVSVFNINQAGPELWTGGAFGPEGGLLCSFAILLGIVLTLIWLRIQSRLGKDLIYIPLANFTNHLSKQRK